MARPALEPAHPSGAVAGTLQPVERAACDVLMDDGSWGYAEAMGWAQDISGPWRIRLLYDDAGRSFLDVYNNVPLVGHSHPRVVQALQEQIALLNTKPGT